MKPLRQCILAAILLLIWSIPSFAGRGVTFYLDGSVVERSEYAKNGYLEILLPPSVRPDTLRLKPQEGARIVRVKVDKRLPGKRIGKELAAADERIEALKDRIKALSVKEETFRVAARSQSAKSPRKTKTNPEPLAAIRQGTDHAIAQLEGVFRLQRKAGNELKQLEEKRSRLLLDEQAGGSIARIWLSPGKSAVNVSYVQTDRSWKPRYDLRVEGDGKASLDMYPDGFDLLANEHASVRIAMLADGQDQQDLHPVDRMSPLLSVDLSAVRESGSGGPLSPVNLSVNNTTATSFPKGEFICFLDGTYLGRGQLPQLMPGATALLQCGGN